MKYTHKVIILSGDNQRSWFKSAIIGEMVFYSEFTRPDGSKYEVSGSYRHHSGLDNLTPELWYDNPERWKVEKLNKFKGNK